MINRVELSNEQARDAIQNGEFGNDVIRATESVALILTQSWCPDWTFMKMSLNGLKDGLEDLDLTVFTYEYDRSPLFQEFMSFKENTYRNWEVPYLRLYKDGRFIGDGNAIPAGRMVEKLRKA